MNKLKISEQYMQSKQNPVAPVQVDIAHQIGRPGIKGRPIVVQLALRRGKDIIFSHVKNLKGSGVFITEQLPADMREKRDAQFINLNN